MNDPGTKGLFLGLDTLEPEDFFLSLPGPPFLLPPYLFCSRLLFTNESHLTAFNLVEKQTSRQKSIQCLGP